MKRSIEIHCWDDETNEEVEPSDFDFEHAREMINEGYTEGEIIGDNYSGWWKYTTST